MYPYIRIGMIAINTFSLVLQFAFFTCIWLLIEDDRLEFMYIDVILKSLMSVTVCSAIGGKIVYFITIFMSNKEKELPLFAYFNGSVFYGGLIGGWIGLQLYCKRHDLKILDLADVYISVLPLGQAIGRVGCYFNGCCYGKYSHGILSVPYIVNEVEVQVFPTWFAESAFCLLLFVAFRLSHTHYSGYYVSRYLVLYGIYRFLIEYVRGDLIRGVWGMFSTSQIISLLLIPVGFSLMVYAKKNDKKNIFYKKERGMV